MPKKNKRRIKTKKEKSNGKQADEPEAKKVCPTDDENK